jgi:TonB dependent receptor.
MGITK